MDGKVCADCGVIRPLEQFAAIKLKTGRMGRDSYCVTCRKQYAARRAAERRIAATPWSRIQPKALRKLRQLKEREAGS